MKTIFLDRDGVINKDFGYVYKWDNFKFINGSLLALQNLTKHNFQIIIVTNQAGIARGIYTEKDLQILTNNFFNFCNKNKVKILDLIFCPHHVDGVIPIYTKYCNKRKPNPGMFIKASKRYNLELKSSFMVGDNVTDIQASTSAGIIENYLVDNKNKDIVSTKKLNFIFKKNLLEASNEIILKHID